MTLQTAKLIFEFVITLGALVFVHEFGHFIACKLLKIEVEEFGFGFPPRALKLFELGGTKFTLNWLPFGGFVRPKGEMDPTIPGGLSAASPWKRIAVFLAGPTMNLLTAVILVIIINGIISYLPDRNHVQVVNVVSGSPASAAGLQAGDILVRVGGVDIHSFDNVRTVTYANLGKPLEFTYERDGVTHEVTITPLANPPDTGAVGIGMYFPTKPFTLSAAIPESLTVLYDYPKELFSMLGRIIQGDSTSSDRAVGFKGMFDMYAWVRESPSTAGVPQIVNIMGFIASISIALGIMNLLPIPAVDGGRILFTLPEIIIHRRIPPKYEMVINFVSFSLLIALMIYINLMDFVHPITLPIP